MNCFAATAVRSNGGWHGMTRYVDKAEFWPVVTKDGSPKLFGTFEAAKLAACDALIKHMNSLPTRSGTKLDLVKAKAGRVFIKGQVVDVEIKNGRKITVEPKQRKFHKIRIEAGRNE